MNETEAPPDVAVIEREIARWQLEHITVNGIDQRLRRDLATRLATIAPERQAALEAALREIQDLGRLSPEEFQGQRDSKLVRMVEPFAFTSSHSRTNAIELGRRAWAEADKLTQRMRDRARLALRGEG